MTQFDLTRRRIIQVAGAGLLLPGLAPAVIASVQDRPKITDGVQSGDLQGNQAVVWSRSDRPSRMVVEWDTRSMFTHPRRVVSALADQRTDFTARVELSELPGDQAIFYRVHFEDAQSGVASEPWFGHLRSAPEQRRDLRFVWSGDTVGQGFGINPDIGGMRIYEAMRLRLPDFFIHSGDTIYADGPVPAQITAEDGRIWRNITTEAKSKVAETLDEYRGAYRYNLLDDNLRRFNAQVPQIWQWDDHEVTNNWSPNKQLDDRYKEKDIRLLASRGRQAFLKYAPMRLQQADSGGAHLSPTQLWPAAGCVRAGHAQLSRWQRCQSGREAGAEHGVSRSGATGLAQGRAQGFRRTMESHCCRHAHWPGRAGR
jgi:alkaline phosphatase D